MKNAICSALGAVGSFVANFFGGWDLGMQTLLIFMVVDYITGLIVAGVFKKSSKSATGGLESKAGWKGICKKGVTLLFVLIAHRLDLVIGTSYIRDAVIIAFVANELISIIENAGLMGVPIPKVITKAIDILQDKAKESSEEEQTQLDTEDEDEVADLEILREFESESEDTEDE